jgi:hypothetical protein
MRGLTSPPPLTQLFFAFPPSPLFADISKTVVELWKTVQPPEVIEWAELARDIRIAHTYLVAAFGNGVVFDGKDWEEQRQYHARSLYFKWMGLQAIHGTAGANGASVYDPQNWSHPVRDPIIVPYVCI